MKLIPYSVTRQLARKSLVMKKNSPHIFFAVGVAGVVGSTIMACRATLKLEETVDEIKIDLGKVRATKNAEGNTEQQYYRELGAVYTKSSFKLGRLYGPSVVVGVAAIGALTGSHVQLTRRNTALTMTLAAVSKAFDEYRVRVREEIGEDKERDIWQSCSEETFERDGKKQKAKVVNGQPLSPYARLFDKTSTQWTNNAEMNRIFIQVQQNYANNRLRAYGHVFLNEVYDSLGIDRTPEGQVVGWVRDPENGDGYIDFGMYEASNRDNPWEPSIWLDFNVDGMIYELI